MPRKTLLLALAASQAAAFGSIDLGDQAFEHERITRNALSCPDATPASPPYDCFEPLSMAMLAGQKGTFGAVGAPDADETFESPSHCDNADFLDMEKFGLEGTYAVTREEAFETLFGCVRHLRSRVAEGLERAEGMMNKTGFAEREEVDVDALPCAFVGGVQGRAKCDAIEGFGRALHGVQDFFAHSNWVDVRDVEREVSASNPPGLDRSDRPPFLNLHGGVGLEGLELPRDLTTGCFIPSVMDPVGAAAECDKDGRITHDTLNKDKGLITIEAQVEIGDVETASPETPRGQVARNFERAVAAAVEETRRQWDEFRGALRERYGEELGGRMVRTLVVDFPWEGAESKSGEDQGESQGEGQGEGLEDDEWVMATEVEFVYVEMDEPSS